MMPEFDVERLAKTVRAAWVAFCTETGDDKPSHLAPWENLSAWDQEADRRIATAVSLMRDEDWRAFFDLFEAFEQYGQTERQHVKVREALERCRALTGGRAEEGGDE